MIIMRNMIMMIMMEMMMMEMSMMEMIMMEMPGTQLTCLWELPSALCSPSSS